MVTVSVSVTVTGPGGLNAWTGVAAVGGASAGTGLGEAGLLELVSTLLRDSGTMMMAGTSDVCGEALRVFLGPAGTGEADGLSVSMVTNCV